jgi:protein tyrosine phosphatase
LKVLASINILSILNREERNLDKSRYRDVIPGEATRVKLQPDGDEKSDFINANYVSGHHHQEKAYIFAQGKKYFLV